MSVLCIFYIYNIIFITHSEDKDISFFNKKIIYMAEENSTQREAQLAIKNCLDCPHHNVLPDPDPDDWFNDDDMRVVCTKAQKDVTRACRPYNLEKESAIPNWCPLLNTQKT